LIPSYLNNKIFFFSVIVHGRCLLLFCSISIFFLC
jgi:hypothetical protein